MQPLDGADRTRLLREHPRPTFARPGWVSLDGPWEFTSGSPGDAPLALAYDATITVPYPPESAASGIGVDLCEHPRYRRTFTATADAGTRVLLHFEGVDHDARVWVDGHPVGAHAGGYTPFTLDITDALTGSGGTGGVHTLVVAAEDDARDLELPRGKQAWTTTPAVIWYRRSSGIWRGVWLEEVPATRLDAARWVTETPRGDLTGTVWLAGHDGGQPLTVEATFRHGDTLLARHAIQASGPQVEFRLRLGDPRTATIEDLLWSPDRPALIDIDLRLLRAGTVIDEVASYTGLRTVQADAGHVTINGERTFCRLVLEQAYWPDTHFTAPSADDLRAEARLVADLGFNGLRMHQVSADPRFLRACDELGLMVWADLPAAQAFTAASLRRTVDNLTGLIERDRNHPSVIAWVPFNESWGVPDLARSDAHRHAVVALHALARALDPTRLALGNDGWEHVVGDVIGVHDYSHDAGKLRRKYGHGVLAATLAWRRPFGRRQIVGAPGVRLPGGTPWGRGRQLARMLALEGTPVLLSEFGGVSLDSDAEAWKGYGRVRTPSALLERVAALVDAVGPGSALAGFCWTQLTDTLQEQNGLAWPDRTPKAPVADLRAVFAGTREAAS
ncbi:glycoside hydrolase family 2 TIM barrel-domain containing protein [Propioniciclava sp.]|uniref:glycoside hydrolase family 2 protein n=1 Tax=Propioniciclava sp. TaxID=2038686 RepID=UPI00260587A1|nr:glycoside hydrolase family 2 TIM barrel-domain containing protein [Propioniciclava sp.]